MAATIDRYNPRLFSERLAPNASGSYTLCRAAVLAMMYDAGTLGEWTTNPSGSRWGKAKVKGALEDMRAATGEPLRDGYNQSHADDFLRGINAPTDAYDVRNVGWSDLEDDLRRGYSVDLAGDVKHTPLGSPLRKYVDPVAHDILLLRINDRTGRITFIDPMTPPGQKAIRTAPIADFRAFGSEFRNNGAYTAGRVKKGKYTQEAILRARGTADGPTTANLKARIETLKQEILDLETQAVTDNTEISTLEQALADASFDHSESLRLIEKIEAGSTGLRNLLL
jgi:hypothetical protein